MVKVLDRFFKQFIIVQSQRFSLASFLMEFNMLDKETPRPKGIKRN